MARFPTPAPYSPPPPTVPGQIRMDVTDPQDFAQLLEVWREPCLDRSLPSLAILEEGERRLLELSAEEEACPEAYERIDREGRTWHEVMFVAERLIELPELDRAFCDGLGWASVQLLALVATPEDVTSWIERAERLEVHELARYVTCSLQAKGRALAQAADQARAETRVRAEAQARPPSRKAKPKPERASPAPDLPEEALREGVPAGTSEPDAAGVQKALTWLTLEAPRVGPAWLRAPDQAGTSRRRSAPSLGLASQRIAARGALGRRAPADEAASTLVSMSIPRWRPVAQPDMQRRGAPNSRRRLRERLSGA